MIGMSLFAAICLGTADAPRVTFESLLKEMTDRNALARFPVPEYESLQATSYNRESVHRDKPGWFADSDGTGFIRTEQIGGKTEWVIMEHQGPGCITKMWTPFFYMGFDDRVGPNVRVYLDGSDKPVLDESLIKLVCGKGSVPGPFAAETARAGNLYLPIPFGKSAKVTLTKQSFYYSVNYRGYAAGTKVETFKPEFLKSKKKALDAAAKALVWDPDRHSGEGSAFKGSIEPGKDASLGVDTGPGCVTEFTVILPDAVDDPTLLRTTVLSIEFDGEQTVWCPVGDFFCSADAVHPYQTWTHEVRKDGWFTCRWPMPFQKSARVRLINLGEKEVRGGLMVSHQPWKWDDRSMHFHANWRPDEIIPGTPFQDWNFIDIQGKGVYVGDAWTVLNMRPNSWWGEGDEKIYVDGAWDKGFPTHFGTGTEDYYGWAGGEYPVVKDEFAQPFLANVKVGGLDGHTQGYNINTRIRSLDAIPFHSRLRFDMEASFGTDMRQPWDLLGYSAVTFWYALPGAKHNRPALPEAAKKPILKIGDLEKESGRIKGTMTK